mmetsp:Transcript_24238/g.27095  ORF Transcript_24238/g.27095 Transcript_24238/m.27095 type:complete len:98 (+) Transcript_24238:20-313(+)
MGNSSSYEATTTATHNSNGYGNTDHDNNNDIICLDCEKKNQKDLLLTDPISSSGQPCADLYIKVSYCMTKYEGQITSCTDEWDDFRKCHQQQTQKPG